MSQNETMSTELSEANDLLLQMEATLKVSTKILQQKHANANANANSFPKYIKIGNRNKNNKHFLSEQGG